MTNKTAKEGITSFNKNSQKALNKVRENYKIVKTKKKLIKQKNVSSEALKNSQRIKRQMIQLAKTSIKATKILITSTISTIKGIIVGTKALIGAIVGGGWLAVVIILICCLVGLLCSSIYGIFLSNEDVENNNITINDVIRNINNEVSIKISNIQQFVKYDESIVNSNQADWKKVLAIYVAKTSNGENKNEFLTFDNTKSQVLKTVFWDMNQITHSLRQELKNNKNSTILYINVNSKSLDEMMNEYNFSSKQQEQVKELLSSKYDSLWPSVIYGISTGKSDMVQIALSQVGNVGGQPYWSWYGFSSRVEWCAVFVSWVANQNGYIESGIIPKFSVCETGAKWFKDKSQWQPRSYIPSPGDIIFFDWELDGRINHVGIVEKVEDNIVYTIEGNSNDDMCRQKEYKISNKVIVGYGTPAY